MTQILRLMAGFVALIIGAIITIPLPEFGIPLVLLGTRLLGNRYKWAKFLNHKVDSGWAKTKAWFKRAFRLATRHSAHKDGVESDCDLFAVRRR